jgi:archaellum component FlaC
MKPRITKQRLPVPKKRIPSPQHSSFVEEVAELDLPGIDEEPFRIWAEKLPQLHSDMREINNISNYMEKKFAKLTENIQNSSKTSEEIIKKIGSLDQFIKTYHHLKNPLDQPPDLDSYWAQKRRELELKLDSTAPKIEYDQEIYNLSIKIESDLHKSKQSTPPDPTDSQNSIISIVNFIKTIQRQHIFPLTPIPMTPDAQALLAK